MSHFYTSNLRIGRENCQNAFSVDISHKLPYTYVRWISQAYVGQGIFSLLSVPHSFDYNFLNISSISFFSFPYISFLLTSKFWCKCDSIINHTLIPTVNSGTFHSTYRKEKYFGDSTHYYKFYMVLTSVPLCIALFISLFYFI